MEIIKLKQRALMKYLLFSGLFFIHLLGFSQTPYGNEWIKAGQPYIKIKISEKGVYKITHSQLQALGFLNNNPNPSKFQIFYLGEEIPLHVEGENDNSFDSSDYIEFFAAPNNAKVDEVLYKNQDQPNKEVSLFSDEAVFFLTISITSNGKRYQDLVLNSSGLTPENSILYTSSANFYSTYYPGEYVLAVMSLSDYIEGEGYLGSSYGLGGSQSRTLNTPNFFSGSSFQPLVETYIAGRSNAAASNTANNNHHFRLSIGATVLKDTSFRGYKTVRTSVTANGLTLGNTTDVVFSSINDLGATTDFQAPGYARITYPRSLDGGEFNALSFKLNSSNTQCLLNFSNTSTWSEAYVLDPLNAKRYKSTKTGTVNSFTINNAGNPLFVYNASGLKNAALENVSFNLVDASTINAKMLMVTHSSLSTAVDNLAAYKNSKGVSSIVLKTDDIYNQFCYGLHHPLAIRNLSRYLLEKATKKPEYLFLIGKGYEYSKEMMAQDLVPTMGYPPSDNQFTAKIIDDTLAPGLATGRLPAKTPADVDAYLEKLRLFEQQPNDLWRKTIINITGGGNSGEDASFSGYLKRLSSVSDKEYFGSSTISYYKSVTDPITDNLTEKINKTIENGANLVTFLGHGSTTGTAVSVGNAKDIQRILFYIINGCSTGNAFTNASLGEDFILEKQRGAIGWIGTSSEGVASYLSGLTYDFYLNSFKLNYGKSVAKNLSSSIRSYQNQNDPLNKIHCQQFIFLGDPSLTFYAPDKPDYEIKPSDVSILENNVTANSPSFKLALIIKNNGKATLNPVKIEVTRTLSDKTTVNYPAQSFTNLLNTDTVYFNIDNNILNAAGLNTFSVKIDPDNEIQELNKLNNSTEFSFLFASNGATLVSPSQYSIVNSNSVELKVQSNNLFTTAQNYFFEIDTVKTFDSAWKKASGTVSSGLFASWKPNILLEQNKVYYWRAKIDADLNNGGQWQSSSFTYILGSEPGWNQSHKQQFADISLKNITPDFIFTNTVYPIRISTRGQNSPSTAERRIRVGGSNTSPSYNGNDFNGIAILAIDPLVTTKRFNYPSPLNFKNDGINGTGVFYFDTNSEAQVDSLIAYVNKIPTNYNVLGVSGLNFAPNALPESAKTALRLLGLSVFENVANGEPYLFITKKGASPNDGTAIEMTAGITEDILRLYDIPYPWSNGSYTSEKIGPAGKWDHASIKFSSSTNDHISSSIIGISSNGTESVLKQSDGLDLDLTDVNADLYPYLKIKTNVTDNIDFTAPILTSWKILYDGYPEVSFNPEFKNSFYSEKLQEGDSLKLSVGLTNIKEIASDSLQIKYKITKQDRTTVNGSIANLAGLTEGKSLTSMFSLPTLGLTGLNVIELNVTPKNNKDELGFNNYLSYNFEVLGDVKNPLIDLLFDGKHIINGETVSPKPNITVSVLDENTFMLLNDTSAIKVYLKKSEDGDFERLSFSSNKISLQNVATADNNKANFLVQPGLLEDGIYTLKIVAVDKSGNGSTSDLLIDFEVINEQTISNFLPYPNPVTNSTRFVFKITGEKVPDKIKIQIMTASGKIVREVNKSELGNIRIGNNISDFVWDGTDTYGDRLANGVYFYNVTVQNNDGSAIKKSYNKTDKMFRNNTGKIYLMK